MNDKSEAVELKLDTLTTSTRFIAGIAPKTATRVGLGVALAIEDSATDPTGRLFGAKVHQGASVLASGLGSIASTVRDRARAKTERVVPDGDTLATMPAVARTRGFVSQAVAEVRGAWADAGYVTVPAEGQTVPEADAPVALSDDTGPVPATKTPEPPMAP